MALAVSGVLECPRRLPRRQGLGCLARVRWRQHARVIAAYRDRYAITDGSPLGQVPQATAQMPHFAHLRARSTETSSGQL